MNRNWWAHSIGDKKIAPKVKLDKLRKKKYTYEVEKHAFGGIQTLQFVAYTKSEARALYKKEYGIIRPGTIFTKVS